MFRLKLYLLFYLLLSHLVCVSQCLILNGDIKDAKNSNQLSADLFVNIDNKKIKLSNSNNLGEFSIKIPCEAKTLIIERKGYRSFDIPLNNPQKTDSSYCSFYLIPLDKQVLDYPYSQSEQQDLLMNNNKNLSKKQAIRIFKIVDANTKQTINAKICLFYTKSGQKKCFEIDRDKQEKIVFSEEDIVALEVEKNGYKGYDGNLIIDKLDNNTIVYEISLSKTQTIASFSVVSGEAIQDFVLIDKSNQKTTLTKKGNYFYGLVRADEEYSYKLTANQKEIIGKATMALGLNTFVVEKASIPDNSTVISNATVLAPQVIYFEQSDFNLTKAAKVQLNAIAQYLKNSTKIKTQIIGYTDNIGTPRLNDALSEYRAKITLNHLLKLGITQDRLEWKALGSRNPQNSNDTEANKQKNRRVEIIFFQ